MRTTLNLDDELVRLARRRAAAAGTTVTAVIEEALRDMLTRPPPEEVPAFRWTTVSGSLRPGVQLDDRDGLYALMDDL